MMCKVSRRAFRFLVVFSELFPFVSALVLSKVPALIPIDHSKLVFESSEYLINIVVVINFLLGGVVSIGLFMFKKWSQPAAIITTCIGLCVYCFYSYFADTGFKVAGDQLSALMAGALISLAYFSSVAEEFR